MDAHNLDEYSSATIPLEANQKGEAMKIEQLLIQEIGKQIGGFDLSIKTFKKIWQTDKNNWQQVICMDETGEMPVDVLLGPTRNTLRGHGTKIHVIVAVVQDAEYLNKDRKKLVVHEYYSPTTIGDPGEKEEFYGASTQVIRSKIKCWQVAAFTQREDMAPRDILQFAESDTLVKIIDSIMEA